MKTLSARHLAFSRWSMARYLFATVCRSPRSSFSLILAASRIMRLPVRAMAG